MRIARYFVLELCVLAVSIGGVWLSMGRFASALAARSGAGRPALAALSPRASFSLPQTELAEEAAGTFLGMSDELLLARIRSQPIVRAKVNKGGSSLSFRLDFADGSRAAFKPAQTNLQTIPRKEVAAYRLNRLLGLNAVPPAAPRAVSREDLLAHLNEESLGQVPRIQAETIFQSTGVTLGAVSYWVPAIKDSMLDGPEAVRESLRWLTQGEPIPPEKARLAAQISDLVVFDFLTSNPDRYSGGNMLMSPDGEKLYFMDNTLAFFVSSDAKETNRKMLAGTQRFSRRLYKALPRVFEASLRGAFEAEPGVSASTVLTDAELGAVVARRRHVQRHIDGLIEQFGAEAVLCFP